MSYLLSGTGLMSPFLFHMLFQQGCMFVLLLRNGIHIDVDELHLLKKMG